MPTYSTMAAVRDDFRCSLCRQKNTFHCEHDTPYRDQLLGTYDQEKGYHIQSHKPRVSDQRQRQSASYSDPAYSYGIQEPTYRQQTKSTVDPRQQRLKTDYNQSSNPVQYNYPPVRVTPHKKDKSCTIL